MMSWPGGRLAVVAGALMAMASCGTPQRPPQEPSSEPFKRISADDLAGKLQRNEAVSIYDANMRDRYEQGHIPGARWIDVLAFTPSELPSDARAPLVFYCFNPRCTASHMAAARASKMGHGDVSVMVDGIQGWEKAKRPVVAGASP